VIVLAGVLVTAQVNDLSLAVVGLIAVSPLMLWIFESGPLARLSGWTLFGSRLIAVALPLAAASALSITT
jgi:hypothetical protein